MTSRARIANTSQDLLSRRLLKDIEELKRNPYPGIQLAVDEKDLKEACLILAPENESPLHLTVHFDGDYPLSPPDITIQSSVSHPNVFGDRICINLLIQGMGYTPAYTLKGICIQMLSFFFSDNIEQMWGENGGLVNRKEWQGDGRDGFGLVVVKNQHSCKKCGFGGRKVQSGASGEGTAPGDGPSVSDSTSPDVEMTDEDSPKSLGAVNPKDPALQWSELTNLPGEILLIICDYLDEEALLLAARSWNGFGRVMRQYNVIRTRELQCFTLKSGFNKLELGVGVHLAGRAIQSEFDLVSRTAYDNLNVRQSIQGLSFEHWLPLPIAQKHWDRVRPNIDTRLTKIANAANIAGSLDKIIYAFMNEVVVRLSTEAEVLEMRDARYDRDARILGSEAPKSTFSHASEKAIESYFHLFHLLLCMACERPGIPTAANSIIKDFLEGQRDKQKVPNLGHLLIMILISDVDSPGLSKAVILEAITRNVVWMLDLKGKCMAELSFMETDDISQYRLQKTFEAGKTSYRLLMFLNVMRKEVRSARGYTDKETGEVKLMSLSQLRDSLFGRHGAPPNGAASRLANRVKDIQKVGSFPQFLAAMDMTPPSASNFTTVLRGTVQDSMAKGYTKWALSQEQALALRLQHEPKVGKPDGMMSVEPPRGKCNFFPGNDHGGNGGRGGRGGGRGGRGGWRGGK